MPALSSFRIRKFQSHEDSVFLLHPNLNVIIGSSNSGKTGFCRALLFFISGTWSKSFVRFGNDDSQIEGQFEDGSIIEKTKGSVNKISHTDINGKRNDYSGFGDNIPKEVYDTLGIYPFKIDKDKELQCNVSMQHDALFLLKETGSYCAKVLGRLSGLHLVDIALRNLSSDSKNCSMRISLERQRIEVAKKELEKYVVLEDRIEKLKVMKEELDNQKRIRERIDKMNHVLREIDAYNLDVKSNKKKIEQFRSINVESIREEFTNKLVEVGLCPACGTTMTDELAKNCLENG